MMLFLWHNHNIAIATVLDFDSSIDQKKSDFEIISDKEEEHEECNKETKCSYWEE